MPNGPRSNGPRGLKKVMLERKDEFVDVLAGECSRTPWAAAWSITISRRYAKSARKTAAEDERFSALVLAGRDTANHFR